eukprot:s119_g79.t1
MAQSQALTTLVAQIAGSSQDPMTDLQVHGGASSRGAMGRARLQAEPAAQKGVFFDAVVKSMAKRMAPTASAERAHAELLAAGVSGTRYLGRYGRCRDLGLIQYQVMSIVDSMMAENWTAAKDMVALMSVMIEQASLDNGRFELAQILTLREAKSRNKEKRKRKGEPTARRGGECLKEMHGSAEELLDKEATFQMGGLSPTLGSADSY